MQNKNTKQQIGHYGSDDGAAHSVLLERPVVIDAHKKELLSDLTFSRGFGVTPFHSNSWDGKYTKFLTYDGKKAVGREVWRLAQWGCTKDIATDSTFTRDGNVFTYTDGGKTLRVNTNVPGNVSLSIKGSVEYPLDAQGKPRDRLSASENWPHILLEQLPEISISRDCQRLIMEIEYEVDTCESLVDRTVYPVNPELHAGQFQWFLMLKNNDETSPSYGSKIWFGFSMFDTRAIGGTPNGFHAYDGGKEDSTGIFIYMPSITELAQNPDNVVQTLPSSVLGKKVRLRIDVLPELTKALQIVQSYGEMQGASVKKLTLLSTNVGWELPGNYDVNVNITKLNIYEEY